MTVREYVKGKYRYRRIVRRSDDGMDTVTFITNVLDQGLERDVSRADLRNLPQTLDNRVPIQEAKAEFHAQIFPWRQRQCYRDPDMG